MCAFNTLSDIAVFRTRIDPKMGLGHFAYQRRDGFFKRSRRAARGLKIDVSFLGIFKNSFLRVEVGLI